MPETVTAETLQDRLAEIHAEQNPGPVQLDPMLLATLLEILMNLASGCLKQRTPKQVADFARQHPVLTNVQLRQAIREAGIPPRERDAAFRTLAKAASEATPQTVQALAAMGNA